MLQSAKLLLVCLMVMLAACKTSDGVDNLVVQMDDLRGDLMQMVNALDSDVLNDDDKVACRKVENIAKEVGELPPRGVSESFVRAAALKLQDACEHAENANHLKGIIRSGQDREGTTLAVLIWADNITYAQLDLIHSCMWLDAYELIEGPVQDFVGFGIVRDCRKPRLS